MSLGIKINMSYAYHLKTDESTNSSSEDMLTMYLT